MNEVYSEGQKIRSVILEHFGKAERSISVAMAFFTDQLISNAILEAAKRGVDVRVVLSNAENNLRVIDDLKDSIDLRVMASGNSARGMMHMKFAIVDSKRVLHGSYNYTHNAYSNNREVLNISSDVLEYERIFEELYTKSDEFNSIGRIEDKLDNKEGFATALNTKLSGIVRNVLHPYDAEEVESQGRASAEANSGSPQIFRNYLQSFLAQFQQQILSNPMELERITSVLRSTGVDLINTIRERFENQRNRVEEEYANKIDEKETLVQEENDVIAGIRRETSLKDAEKEGISNQINALTDEISEIRNSLGIQPFWTWGNVLKIAFLIPIFVILSVFFASTLFNFVYAETIVRKALSLNQEWSPSIIYFDILPYLKTYAGNYIALFIFVIPLAVSFSSPVFIKMGKIYEIIVGWIVAIFVLDIYLAIQLGKTLHNIRNIVTSSNLEFSVWNAIIEGDIVIIFLLGAFPLIIAKAVILGLHDSFVLSNPGSLDRFKSAKIGTLLTKKIALEKKLSEVTIGITDSMNSLMEQENKREAIKEDIRELRENRNLKLREISETLVARTEDISETVDRYVAMITQGDLAVLKQGMYGKASAFKVGFNSWIQSYFSPHVAGQKIQEIEKVYEDWIN